MNKFDRQSYENLVEDLKRDLAKDLKRGRASTQYLAIQRLTIQLLEEELKKLPRIVVGRESPVIWMQSSQILATKRFDPSGPAYNEKYYAYTLYGEKLQNNVTLWREDISDRKNGIKYIQRAGPGLKKIVAIIAAELIRWTTLRKGEDWYLRESPAEGLQRMLEERTDLVAAFRLMQSLSIDVQKVAIQIERLAHEELVEIIVGFIPVIGNVVTAYEAYEGRDLFGYRLNKVERSVLAASILLPVAARFVRGGRSLYTAKRMRSLYYGP